MAESALMNMVNAAEEQQFDAERQLNPQFQQDMFLIESALRQAGLMSKAADDAVDTTYDDYFLQLINAIPVE